MARDAEEAKSSVFKVVDRRRFDSGGEERAGVAPVAPPTPPPTPEPARAPKPEIVRSTEAAAVQSAESERPPVEAEPEAAEGDISFGSFVMSLATQALMQLGAVEPPPGVRMRVDRKLAKQTIDIIEMLRKKTKGNLNPDETRMMEEISHQLRVCFLGVA